jgi:hypothetical protein
MAEATPGSALKRAEKLCVARLHRLKPVATYRLLKQAEIGFVREKSLLSKINGVDIR